jgi:hypothetical protein
MFIKNMNRITYYPHLSSDLNSQNYFSFRSIFLNSIVAENEGKSLLNNTTIINKNYNTNQKSLSSTRINYTNSKRSPSFSVPSAVPSLQHFVLRCRTLSLYRSILRLVSRKGKRVNQIQREEIMEHANTEFRNMKNVTDIPHIKALLAEGSRRKQQLESLIDMTR